MIDQFGAAPGPHTVLDGTGERHLDGPGSATARGDEPWHTPRVREVASPFSTLRPVGPGAVLDGGFDLLRSRFRRLVALAACLYVPIRILDLAAMIAADDATEQLAIGPAFLGLGGGSALTWVVVALQSLALSILGLCVGHLTMRMIEGTDATFTELLTLGLRRSWVALLILPLNLLVRAPLWCIPLGFVFADVLVFITSVVAGAEALGPVRAWRRGLRLTRRAIGPMIGVVIGGVIISQMLRFSFYFGPVALAATFGASDAVLTAVSQAGALVVLIAEPLTACIAARAYLELRCRHEGLDLRRRVHERFEAPRLVAEPIAPGAR